MTSTISKSTSNPPGMDELEQSLGDRPSADIPVTHTFAPGIYIRQVTIPKNAMLTSMEHLTEHPFIISKGRISVTSETEGSVTYEAPHHGITKPGTRRALYAHEDTVWTTFHITDLTDPIAIGESILARPTNPLLATPPEQWRHPNSSPTLPCHS